MSLPALLLAASTAQAEQVGVLILAHGGTSRWNQAVQDTVAAAGLTDPTQIAFGMGMHPEEGEQLQQAVDALERAGVSRIIAVPLLISSASEVMRQYQYLLGLRDHGPWEAHVRPVTHRVPIVLTQPLDDDPVVADVLVERAAALSRNPSEETVVLIAHGPTSEDDNAHWLAAMERLAAAVRTAGHFRAVLSVTMRDDAPEPVQAEATRRMRELIERENRLGRTLVVPLLLASGGVEAKIPQRLQGLSFAYTGQALLPHPKLAQWIAGRVRAAAASPSAAHRPMRRPFDSRHGLPSTWLGTGWPWARSGFRPADAQKSAMGFPRRGSGRLRLARDPERSRRDACGAPLALDEPLCYNTVVQHARH